MHKQLQLTGHNPTIHHFKNQQMTQLNDAENIVLGILMQNKLVQPLVIPEHQEQSVNSSSNQNDVTSSYNEYDQKSLVLLHQKYELGRALDDYQHISSSEVDFISASEAAISLD